MELIHYALESPALLATVGFARGSVQTAVAKSARAPPSPSPPPETTQVRVLVTVPVRNEVNRLRATLEELDRSFSAAGLDYRLSVAEDGSTDGTKEVLRELPSRIPGLLIQEEEQPLGRGLALRQLWSRVDADVYCFTDTDLAAGAEALVGCVRRVMHGMPIVVGSRYAPGSSTHRPPLRGIVSRAYNLALRLVFRENIRDHQCGLKAFSFAAIRKLLPLTKEDSWFWDSEILVLALRHGFTVVEVPVEWSERKTSRTKWRRLLSDIYLHGVGIIRLKSRIVSRPLKIRTTIQSSMSQPSPSSEYIRGPAHP
jgi:glycosyltransferase AglD